MSRKRTSQPALPRRRILIIDEHPLMRRGLKALIEGESDLTVCVEAGSRREVAAVAGARPDLVVVALSFRDGDGLDLVRTICSTRDAPPVLVLTAGGARCAPKARSPPAPEPASQEAKRPKRCRCRSAACCAASLTVRPGAEARWGTESCG